MSMKSMGLAMKGWTAAGKKPLRMSVMVFMYLFWKSLTIAPESPKDFHRSNTFA